MGRKRISKRIKRIILHVGNEKTYFDFDEEEKLIMSQQQKTQLIKKMKKKIFEHMNQKKQIELPKIEIPKQFVIPLPILNNEEEKIEPLPPIQENTQGEETKIISITIDRSDEQPCEDEYINNLTHLFQIHYNCDYK